MKNIIKLAASIIDKKQAKLAVRYGFLDKCGDLVVTDTKKLLVVDTEIPKEVPTLLDLNRAGLEIIVGAFEGFPIGANKFDGIFPDYQRILVKGAKEVIRNISTGDVNEAIFQIMSLGVCFDVKFLQVLYTKNIRLENLELKYNDAKSPFQLEGLMNGYSFKYVISPRIV